MTGKHFFLGVSGSGKSTRLARFAALYNVRAGVITHLRGDERWVRRLDTGEERLLATRSEVLLGDPTPHWTFDKDVLAWADEAFTAPGEVSIVDEIGPLELEAGTGWRSAVRDLDRGERSLTLIALRPALRDVATARWPDAVVRYIKRR